MAIVALGGLEVCDGGHWLLVMKKVEGPRPSEGSDTLPLQNLRGSERKGLVETTILNLPIARYKLEHVS